MYVCVCRGEGGRPIQGGRGAQEGFLGGSPVDLGLEGLPVRTALPATGQPPLCDRCDMEPIFVGKRTRVAVQTEDERQGQAVLSGECWNEDLRAFPWRQR